jgi:hypothetical protein
MPRSIVVAFILIALLALLAATGPTLNPQEAARLNNIGVAYMDQQLFEKALKASKKPQPRLQRQRSRSSIAAWRC